MIKLTGLWKNKTKNGDAMLAGNLGGARIVILKNTYKKAACARWAKQNK